MPEPYFYADRINRALDGRYPAFSSDRVDAARAKLAKVVETERAKMRASEDAMRAALEQFEREIGAT